MVSFFYLSACIVFTFLLGLIYLEVLFSLFAFYEIYVHLRLTIESFVGCLESVLSYCYSSCRVCFRFYSLTHLTPCLWGCWSLFPITVNLTTLFFIRPNCVMVLFLPKRMPLPLRWLILNNMMPFMTLKSMAVPSVPKSMPLPIESLLSVRLPIPKS